MEGFWNWFIGEPGGVWILGILTIVAWFIDARRRERPPKVIVQELGTLRLLDIHPTQQDNVHIYFGRHGQEVPIDCLQQKELVIYNAGTKDIAEAVELVLCVTQPSIPGGALQQLVVETLSEPLSLARSAEGKLYFRVMLPYLNAMPAHNEFHRAYLISDGEITIQRVEGRGRGWSSRYIPKQQARAVEQRVTGMASCLLSLFLLPLSVLFLLASMLDPMTSIAVKLIGLLLGLTMLVLAFRGPAIWGWILQKIVYWRTGARPASTFKGDAPYETPGL